MGATKGSVSKKVLVAVVLALVALVAVSITFIVLYTQALTAGKPTEVKPTPPLNECKTAGCRQAANRLMNSINTKVNPCDDFYEFACGRWNKTEPMPAEARSWGVFNILGRELSEIVIKLLDITHAPDAALNATEKVQRFYVSCVDEKAMDDVASTDYETLRTHMEAIFPQLDTFPWTTTRVAPTVAQSLNAIGAARTYGLSMGIFPNGITSDHEKPHEKNLISFSGASLGLEQSLYLKDEEAAKLKAYETYLKDMMILLGKKLWPDQVMEEMADNFAKDTITFEKVLAKAKLTPEEIRNEAQIVYNKMTLAKFAETYTNKIELNAEDLVNMFKEAWKKNTTVQAEISPDMTINVRETLYYATLTDELRNRLFAADPTVKDKEHRFFATYLVWQMARSYIGYLGTEFQTVSRTLETALTGLSAWPPRNQSCANSVTNQFPNAVGRLYVAENFQKTTKDRLEKMVDYIFDAFRAMVSAADWMTQATKDKTLEKAKNFAVHIGYEDYIVEDSARLNKEHEGLTVLSSYLQNGINKNKWVTEEEGPKLLTPSNPTTWITGAAIVNAIYSSTLNSISFPAGILQPPFLGSDYPDYWNFGAVGMVIGHEITHGFDDRGSQFASNGAFSNWWDKDSRDKFLQRTDELIYQYGNYTLMDQQLNGRLTRGENIADNGGMKEAFFGYKAYIEKEKSVQELLPGLTYTPDQLFFLANAQVWCSDWKLEPLKEQIRTGAHTPGRYRIIGPMQNFEEFSKAYNCPADSYMNPRKRNHVW